MKYDLFNPSSARRIIHDNLPSARRIEILPKGTVKAQALADHVVTHLRAAFKRDPLNELHISESAGVELDADGAERKAPLTDNRIPVQTRELKIDEAGVTVLKAKPAKAAANA